MEEETFHQVVGEDEKTNGFVVKEIPEGTLITTRNNQGLMDVFVKSEFWKESGDSFVGGGTRHGYTVEMGNGDRAIVKNKLTAYRMREIINSADKSVTPKFDKDLARILNSIEHEISAINEAKKRYKDTFGKELSTEDPLCGFIDRRGRKTIVFKYVPDELKGFSQDVDRQRVDWERQTVQELESVGVYPYDAHAIVVKNGSSQPEGYRFVLVDAEKWIVNRKAT